MMDGACKRAIARNEAAMEIAKKVAERGIVAKATERLIYQIVETCAEHERENTKAIREALEAARPFVANAVVGGFPASRNPIVAALLVSIDAALAHNGGRRTEERPDATPPQTPQQMESDR